MLAVSNTIVSAPATSSTAQRIENTRANRRRKPYAVSDSDRPRLRTAGVQTRRRTTTAPKLTSTGSEYASFTEVGGFLTVVWGDGSVRSSTAWADAAGAPARSTAATTAPATPRRRSTDMKPRSSLVGPGHAAGSVRRE